MVFVNIDEVNYELAKKLQSEVDDYLYAEEGPFARDLGLRLSEIVRNHLLQSIQNVGVHGEKMK